MINPISNSHFSGYYRIPCSQEDSADLLSVINKLDYVSKSSYQAENSKATSGDIYILTSQSATTDEEKADIESATNCPTKKTNWLDYRFITIGRFMGC